MGAPLAGLTVLETGSGLAVRYCGRLLAAHGARVIRPARDEPPAPADAAAQAFAAWLDQGKERQSGTAADLLAGGVPWDLAMAGMTPGAVDGAAAALAGRRAGGPSAPRPPVLLGITWFGHDGPYRDWQANDALIRAMTGVAYPFGEVAGPPILAQGWAPQLLAGVTAYIAAVAALLGRRRGHQVSRVDVNVFEANLCFVEVGVANHFVSGVRSVRRGVNRFNPTYPATSYRTAAGWIGVTALTFAQWRSLCASLGLPEMAHDPRFATAQSRIDHADAVDAALAPAFLQRTAAEWLVLGQAQRIPLASMPEPAELPDVPQWKERGSFAPLGAAWPRAMAPTQPFRLQAAGPARRAPQLPAGGRVLSGFRILDLTMGWSGPLATRHLADLGAEVIKVESCTHPDWYRGWDGPFEGDPPPYETKASFAAMNRGKRGITLELTDPRGLVLAQRLAAKSDLLIENYAPGVLDRLGLSAAEAATFAPGIVYVSMGAFGNTGPWREFRAYGSTTEQASGLPFLNGKAEWPPCLQTVAYGDPVAGIYAAAAAVTGLFGQAHAGGAVVDLSQVECLFQLGADGILAATATGRPPARTGSRRTGVVPCGCFPAAGPDAWIALAVETEAQWAALCRLMNQEHLLPLRQAGDEERIDEAVAGWTLQFEAADLAARLQAAGIPAARVTPAHSLREDPHHRQAGYWLELERRHMPRHVVPLAPFRVDGERPSVAGPAPTLGEHNAAVLGEELGVPEAELAGLRLAGVIGSAPRPVK